MIIGYGRIRKTVETGETLDKTPDRFIVRVENMSPVLMNLDPFNFFRINIPGYMIPPVDDQAFSARVRQLPGGCRAKEPRAHNQVVIHFPFPPVLAE